MNRRDFICRLQAAMLASTVPIGWHRPLQAAEAPLKGTSLDPLQIGRGVQLFLDDFLIEELNGLQRKVVQPEKLPQPVLDSATFGTTQPYLTVLHDAEQKQYRIWYNRGNDIWQAVSTDGVEWKDPQLVWKLNNAFGCSLVDDGPNAADPQRRFKMINTQRTKSRKQGKPGDEGSWVGFSPDGMQWTPWNRNPVMFAWPEGFQKFVYECVGDIIDVFYDEQKKQYVAAFKMEALEEDGLAQGPRNAPGFRRLVGMSTSKDFIDWTTPKRIFVPDEQDEGLLEFYGMGGMHQRGGLYIGFLRVLRDDLPCDPGGPLDGIGYTVLATSRDGENWQRFREPFLDRNLNSGTWDHAMAWMGDDLPMGDDLNLYYGGYSLGHKVDREAGRQIGLARMKKDRYAGLVAQRDEGLLRSKRLIVPADRFTINADADADGEVRVRLIAADGASVDAEPIVGDRLSHPVRWREPIASFVGKPAQLEFRIRQATLFGFDC
ncbi:MAG: hypothetical protein WD468_08085 [Pirellulales bacterium]